MHLSDVSIDGLVYYWPVVGNSLTEWINNGASSMHGTGLYSYDVNRFNNPQSTIKLLDMYATIGNGVYVSGDFSITAWININELTYDARIFEVGNTGASDIVAFGFSNSSTGQPFVLLQNSIYSTRVISPVALSANKWIHLATTLNGTTLSIYVDGNVTIQSDVTSFVPENVLRSKCYLGYSSLTSVALPRVLFDQIKIFNRALKTWEVYADFQGPSL